MGRKPVNGRCCPNAECDFHRKTNAGNIIRHSFYKRKDGRRRRYRCKACGTTFSASTGTIYHGLHSSRGEFDHVAQLSVEGMSKSAIARTARKAWNRIAGLRSLPVLRESSTTTWCPGPGTLTAAPPRVKSPKNTRVRIASQSY